MTELEIDNVKSKIEYVRSGAKAYVFKNLVPVTPTWDQFIAHLDDAVHNFQPSPSQEPLEQRIINGVIQRRLFYLMVDGPDQDYYPESQPVHDIFNEALGGEISPVSAFINFIGKERPGGAHTDNRETIYWQCIGEAIWHIFSTLEDRNPIAEYILQPGDVIFVAEGVIHQIRADMPRAALGFQYRPNDPNFNKPQD